MDWLDGIVDHLTDRITRPHNRTHNNWWTDMAKIASSAHHIFHQNSLQNRYLCLCTRKTFTSSKSNTILPIRTSRFSFCRKRNHHQKEYFSEPPIPLYKYSSVKSPAITELPAAISLTISLPAWAPLKAKTLPPASRTRSIPAATSHIFKFRSK